MANRLILVMGDLHIPDRAIDLPAKFKKLLSPGKIGQILCLGNLTSASVYNWLRSLAPDLHVVKGQFDVPFSSNSVLSPQQQQQQQHQQPDPSVAPQVSIPAELYPGPLALSKVVTHGNLRIGFTNGFHIIPPGDPDSLLIQARQMDVDIFCWGGTSQFEAYEMEGKFFINPGSATGAVSWLGDGLDPIDEAHSDDGSDDEKHAGKEGAAAEQGMPTDAVPSFCLMDVQGDVLVLYVYQLKRVDGKEMVHVEKVSYRKGGGDGS